MDRNMIDAASGGALMDKTPVVARHLISNIASNTQQFGIRGTVPSWMVNEVGAIDNLRLENQLTELTSLVRQLVVGQHQPSIAAKVCGICTFMEHPTNICPTLQETESDHPESVGSIGGHQYEKQSYQSQLYDSSNIGRVRVKGNIQLKNSNLPKAHLRLSAESEIPSTIVPTAATTESAIIGQLSIYRGPNEVVDNKKPGVSAYYELQQHAILAKFKCHDPRPQNAGGLASKHCESAIVDWVWKPSLIDNFKSKGECKCCVIEKWLRPANVESEPDVDSLARSIPLPFLTRTLSTRKVETDEDLLKMFRKVEINIPLLDAIK
ncbi:hypothetical protein CR513_44069, partial [Mucuna pruriens]